MSRRIKEDFDNLCDFFKKYSLAPIFEEKDFVKQISTYHKKYYSYLVLVIELKEIVDNANYAPCMSQEQYNYVLESCSDVGQALFLVTHGCYKGAKLLLRSSIENFIKAVCFDEYPDIVIKKSVYEVFDIAKASMTFSGSKKNIFDTIHTEYIELCKDVHTADFTHMEHITALRLFPHFNNDGAENIKRHILRILPVYITLLCLKYNQGFHSIFYSNQEIIKESILTEYKKEIHNLNIE